MNSKNESDQAKEVLNHEKSQDRNGKGLEEKDTAAENHFSEVGQKETTHSLLNGEEKAELDKEITCGLWGWHPDWLQKLASKKAYVLSYGILGTSQSAFGAYFVGTISTIEKRYKIPSTTSGLFASAWDFGALLASLLVAYFGSSGHKTRWVASGALIAGLSAFMRYTPQAIFGSGKEALSYDTRIMGVNTTGTLCAVGSQIEENCDLNSEALITSTILFIAQVAIGMGTATYYTLGAAYLDDNVRKDRVPFLFGLSTSIKMTGPTVGFLLASYALHVFVEPSIKPPFGRDDARWIGAWWLGWIPLGIINILLGALIALFPRTLPREAERRRLNPERWNNAKKQTSFKDFMATMKRLIKNPILMFNSFSTTFYVFGMTGYWIFMPKYIETQFRKSASEASLITGSVGLVCTAIGILCSGYIISKFRPRPLYLALWNIFTETIDVVGHMAFAYIGCAKDDLHGMFTEDGTWNLNVGCNLGCNCSASIQYNPVCSMDQSTTFYSPCHAGCTSEGFENGTKVFNGCSCIPEYFKATEGACPVDCNNQFYLFVVLLCTMQFLASTGRAGNVIIQYRAVDPEDKSISIALLEALICAVAFIPGPIIFGAILDYSCLVWGQTCGQTGNCWLYNGKSLRYILNFTSSGFILIGTLFDIGVALKVKHLKLYDENPIDDKNTKPDEERNDTLMILSTEMK